MKTTKTNIVITMILLVSFLCLSASVTQAADEAEDVCEVTTERNDLLYTSDGVDYYVDNSLIASIEHGYNIGWDGSISPKYRVCTDRIDIKVDTLTITDTITFRYSAQETPLVINGLEGLTIDNQMTDSTKPIFEIAGSNHIELNNMIFGSGENDLGNTAIKCTNGADLTLKNITINNNPTGSAIKIENCSNVYLEYIYVKGSMEPLSREEAEALISITPTDESMSDYTLNQIYFNDSTTYGTGIEISNAGIVSLDNINFTNTHKGEAIVLTNIEDLSKLNVTTKGSDSGVIMNYVSNTEHGQLENYTLNLAGNKNSDSSTPGVGLNLGESVIGLQFASVTTQYFNGDGILIEDSSNSNVFNGINASYNAGRGMAIIETAEDNEIAGSSDFYENDDCGLFLGSGPNRTMITTTSYNIYNNTGCTMDGESFPEISDAVLLYPREENKILVDVNRDSLDLDKYIDIHYYKVSSATDASGDSASQSSYVNHFSIDQLPEESTGNFEESYFAVIKNEDGYVLGIWEGDLETAGNYTEDSNCYQDPTDTSRLWRIYSTDDTDYDLIPDWQEDANHDCVLDATETNPNDRDSDGDNIDDYTELYVGGTNPRSKHSDTDELEDGEEDLNYDGYIDDDAGETDPLVADTDGDGLTDGVERAYGTDPNDTDSDGDGESDSEDNCPTFPNECYYDNCVEDYIPDITIDNDGDGVMDYYEDANQNCQYDPGEMRPDKTDTDGDLIPDGWEDKNANGIYEPENGETNPVDDDTDDDCIPDGLEDKNYDGEIILSSGETDPTVADSDGDGIDDGDEDINCDGNNDAGETKPYLADTDGDGVNDLDDTCPWSIDQNCVVRYCNINGFDSYDADNDGLPDVDEDFNGDCAWTESNQESHPLMADTDGDLLTDDIEVGCFGTNPTTADTDGDGRTDYDEVSNSLNQCTPMYNMGDTDPLNAEFGCSLTNKKDATNGTNLPIILMGLIALLIIVRQRTVRS